jgi:cell division septum initiation protein DivIVA
LTSHLKERYEDLNKLEAEFSQQERRLEEEIISLKIQLEEGKRMEEVMQIQMIKKEKECEKLEEEVVSLRVEVNKLNKNLKSSQVLEDILNSQRPCSDKSGLGYKKIHFEKGSSSMTKETKQKSYTEVIRSPKPSKKNIQVMEEDQPIRGTQYHQRNEYKRSIFPRRPYTFRSFNHQEGNNRREDHDQLRHEFRRTTSQRGSFASRYQSFFLGHCFTCNNFGHKVVNCRAYGRNVQARDAYVPPHNIECYKCHNYGHIAQTVEV